MSRNPENNDARLNYYGVLADTNLFLLLEQEPSNEILEPKFIQLEGNNFALAFDSEENLSEFYGEFSTEKYTSNNDLENKTSQN